MICSMSRLICERSNEIRKIMHTHMEGTEIGYTVRQSVGLSPYVRYFTINQLGYTLVLSETRLPLSHNRFLLTTP